jgi:nitroreductase
LKFFGVEARGTKSACWCAIENLLVAATARGLGSYPSTGDWIDQNFVGPVLGLTEKERPVACIFLGYSEQKTMAKRLPVERHTTWYHGNSVRRKTVIVSGKDRES